MKEQFVPKQQALELRELGFNGECIAHWERGENEEDWYLFSSGDWLTNEKLIPLYKDIKGVICGEILAPLWQQAFDFFREKYNLEIQPVHFWESDGNIIDYFKDKPTGYVLDMFIYDDVYNPNENTFKTYEEARQACLEKIIEIVNGAQIQ